MKSLVYAFALIILSISGSANAETECSRTELTILVHANTTALAQAAAIKGIRECAQSKFGEPWVGVKMTHSKTECIDASRYSLRRRPVNCGEIGNSSARYVCQFFAYPCAKIND